MDIPKESESVASEFLSNVPQADVRTELISATEISTNCVIRNRQMKAGWRTSVRYRDPRCVRMVSVVSVLFELVNVLIPQVDSLEKETEMRRED